MSKVEDKNNIPKLVADFEKILDRVAAKIAMYLEQKILDKMESGDASWPELHPFTVSRKGSTKAWIDTGELRNQITHRITGKSMSRTIKVGIFQSKKAFIALVLEEGATIRVSERMRKFLHAQGLHLKQSTSELHIPPRPLFTLVFDMEEEKILKIARQALEEELNRYTL
jgi:hypothetical protein